MATSSKHLFLAFWASYDDDSYGEDVPLGCVVRLDAQTFAHFNAKAGEMTSGNPQEGRLVSMGHTLSVDNVRWVKKVGFTTENSVAAIPGFMTEDAPLHASEAFLEAEIGVEADYQDVCDIYELPMADARLNLRLIDGKVQVFPGGVADLGRRRQFDFPAIFVKWEDVARQGAQVFGETPAQAVTPQAPGAPSAPLAMDDTDKATILAALTHYLNEGQGEPCSRTDEVHRIAVADDEVISMDDQGIKDLIARVRSVVPQAPSSEVLPGADDARKYFETTILVKVLTEDDPVGDLSLTELAELVDTGPGVGEYIDLSSRQISPQTAARRLTEMGSEPGFFRLDDDGVHEDDIDEDGPALQRPPA